MLRIHRRIELVLSEAKNIAFCDGCLAIRIRLALHYEAAYNTALKIK